MASDKKYLEYILEQLSETDGITYKPMMGEFILYRYGKIFGGIYDNRFLVKPTKSAKELMPNAETALPYKGAKEMLPANNVEDREFVRKLVIAIYNETPEKKKNQIKRRT
ncbi:MAG: TfoX/Sxy family protein [Clostridia bacterium]|nr:TfoX/Sxy family protein [Clostridia bacterium]